MDINKNRFFSNSFWMMGGVGLQAVSAFAANIILARYLAPEEFGVFAIALANVGVAEAIINFRITPLILKLDNQSVEKKFPLYYSITIIQSVVTAFIACVLIYLWDYESISAGLLVLNALLSPIMLLQFNLYERRFNYKNISVIESSSKLFSHIGSVIGVVLGYGAVVLYARVLLETLLKVVGLLIFGEFKIPKLTFIRFKDLKELFFDIKGYWFDSFIEQSFERLIAITAGFLLGEKQMGYFSQAKRLAITPHQILQPLAFRVSLNYFTKAKPAERKILLYRILRNEFMLLFLISILMLLFLPDFISFMYGDAWLPLIPSLYAMVGVVVFLSQFNTIKSYFLATNDMRTFISRGRSLQYIVFIGIVLLSIYLAEQKKLIMISLGLSLSYFVGFIWLLLYVIKCKVSQTSKA